MFGINEYAHAAHLLSFGNDMQSKRGLSGGFRPEYLHNPALRYTADAECSVKLYAAGRNDRNMYPRCSIAHEHYRSLTVLLFYLRECNIKCLIFLHFCTSEQEFSVIILYRR